jgi:DNA-binding CsgD family transcriptional regulator
VCTVREEGGLWARWLSLWPVLPFLGFGLCEAWLSLANGTAWLSAGASNGAALTNFTIVANVAAGVALALLLALRVVRGDGVRSLLMGRGFALAAGAAGSVGALLLILAGPAYLQALLHGASYYVFQAASVLLGASFGALFLRLGALYARLPLRRAILYLCYAHLVGVFVDLCVQVSPDWAPSAGGPSLALIAAFVLLPLAAGASLCLDVSANPWIAQASAPDRHADRPCPAPAGRPAAALQPPVRRALALFAAVLFLFSLVQVAVTTVVTNDAAPTVTLGNYDLIVLVRVPLLMLLAMFASTLEASRFNFSRLCVGLVVLLEVLVVLDLAVDVSGAAWVVSVKSITFVFELLTWCMLFAVANCHQEASTVMIAVGYGACSLGRGLGCALGMALPAAVGAQAFYVACVLLLLPTFLLLNERNVNGLFWGGAGRGTSFEEALGAQLRGVGTRGKGDFARRLEGFAREHALSTREAEALRYLVAGRGDSQIAEAMGISYNTARTHVRNVYTKLGVHDRQVLIDQINECLR